MEDRSLFLFIVANTFLVFSFKSFGSCCNKNLPPASRKSPSESEGQSGSEKAILNSVSLQIGRFPGRFQRETYNNLTIDLRYAENPKSAPYEKLGCAPGLLCKFSDKSWHETSWHDNVVTVINAPRQPNTIYISMESHAIRTDVPDTKNYRGQQYAALATTDLRSEIPLTYLHGDSHGQISSYQTNESSEVKYWKILYLQGNCDLTPSGRNRVVQELMSRSLVDSYGKCMNNKNFSADDIRKYGPRGNKGVLMKRYAFTAAFENSFYPGYATEKVWEALRVGTLPIYLGAPDAHFLFPPRAVVLVTDFLTVSDLVEYINYLIKNKTAYEEHHKWRHEPLPKYLLDVWKFNEEPVDCRLCRWAAENLFSAS